MVPVTTGNKYFILTLVFNTCSLSLRKFKNRYAGQKRQILIGSGFQPEFIGYYLM